jgi:hypothetical protein
VIRATFALALATIVGCSAVTGSGADGDSSRPTARGTSKKAGSSSGEDGPAAGQGGDPSGATPGSTGVTNAPVRTAPAALPVPDGFYPRAIQRANGKIVASVVRALPSGRMGATIFESADDGVSFTEIGAIDDPINQGGLCCGTLYELPRALGALAAGTLLWSASAGGDTPNAPMVLPLWKSEDDGRTWQLLSKIATASKPRSQGGLWEPELSLLDDGTLAAHWSDETDAAHSQKLVVARTSDGVTWRDRHDTVALATFGFRPGMANVRRPPGGPFVMSYEICGVGGDSCTAWIRTSDDGWSWGDPKSQGIRIATVDGLHFRHAPTLAWSAAPGANGRFYVVGQMTYGANGAVAGGTNGSVIFASPEGGTHAWYTIPAPVPVPEAFDNFCPNYSSSVLPLDGGKVALELASKWDGQFCKMYFARGPLVDVTDASELTDGTTYRLVSTQSGLCLDDGVQQPCNGGAAQRWTLTRAGSTLTLSNGASLHDHAWTARAMGTGYYALESTVEAKCLDVAGGSGAAGATVSEWACNDLAPQIWKFEAL